MSRVPSGGYAQHAQQHHPSSHPHPHPHAQSHPHPNQQPVYYPAQQVPPAQYNDPGLYAYDRNGQPMPSSAAPGSRQVSWSSTSDGMYAPPQHPHTAHPGHPHAHAPNHAQQAGPSRTAEGYTYTQPPRASPAQAPISAGAAGGGATRQQSSMGWSSVHPSSAPAPARPDTGTRVKLEDLVSQDRTASTSRPAASRAASTASALGGVPLGKTQSTDGTKEGGNNAPSGPSEFIKKLYRMLEEESALYGKGKPAGAKREHGAKRGSVGWGRGGSSFVVWDMNDFTTKVLPQTFRHSNFSSFVRQLNKYGFSKIKHVEEDTGQIKDNVWEFQHPNFQAGGKSDLESIKRKAVVPKKSTGGAGGTAAPDEDETSPRGLSNEDANRLNEMESRVMGLEDQLARALDEVREARTREMGMMNVMREVIGHLATVEKESVGSPRHLEPSPRIAHLYQHLDAVSAGQTRMSQTSFGQLPLPFPPPPMPFQPPVRLAPVSAMPPQMPQSAFPPMSSVPTSHASPHTDAGSRNGDGPSPAGSRASQHRGSISQLVQEQPQEDVIELPHAAPPPQTGAGANPNQTLFDGEPLGMTPVFADTPAWLTENTSVPLPIYHRRSSDGTAMRIMIEALNTQPADARFEDNVQDPLDSTPPQERAAAPQQTQNAQTMTQEMAPPQQIPAQAVPAANVDPAVAAAAGANAVVQQSPFGTLVIPNGNTATSSTSAPAAENTSIRLRRSTTIKPHWTQTPRILVVEDDVVYRQLSSKFLEKFGCITETVEDAQGAVEKMNATKYDLVLMDIFFGPSMDGRKATSLIRQFDIYTPIISMTSNVQTQDVTSYLQSGMNDVLAKPFTKNGLFGILDKHLTHLKLIQLSAQVPRSLGVPPLSDEGIADAVATSAAQFQQTEVILRNPLAAMGWSDETYQIVLQQFMATGAMPDANAINDGSINAINALGSLGGLGSLTGLTNGAIGTSVVFGDSSGFSNRKRSIETVEDDGWSPMPGSGPGGAAGNATGLGGGQGAGMMQGGVGIPVERSAKKAKK